MKKAVIVGINQVTRIDLISSVLKDQYEVQVLVQDFDHLSRQYKTVFRDDYTYVHMPRFKKNLSPRRLFSYYVWGHNVYKKLKEIAPDLIYVILPPNSGARFCRLYKDSHPETKLVSDVYNLWPEALPFDKYKKLLTLPLSIWKNMRSSCLRESDLIFSECSYYKQFLTNNRLKRNQIETLYLYKPQEEDTKAYVDECFEDYRDYHRKRIENNTLQINLGYLGALNNIIDISRMTDVVSALISRGYAVHVSIIGKGEKEQNFISSLKEAGADVEFFGPIYDDKKKMELFRYVDFCFNVFKKSVIVGLTTKSTDYFSLGLPIINSIQGDTWGLVNKHQVGLNIDAEIADSVIDAIYSDQIIAMRQNALEVYSRNFTLASLKNKVREEFLKHDILQ